MSDEERQKILDLVYRIMASAFIVGVGVGFIVGVAVGIILS